MGKRKSKSKKNNGSMKRFLAFFSAGIIGVTGITGLTGCSKSNNDKPKSYIEVLDENHENTLVDEYLSSERKIITPSGEEKTVESIIEQVEVVTTANDFIEELGFENLDKLYELTDDEKSYVNDQVSKNSNYESVLYDTITDEDLDSFTRVEAIKEYEYLQGMENIDVADVGLLAVEELADAQLKLAALQAAKVVDPTKADEYEFSFEVGKNHLIDECLICEITDPSLPYTETVKIDASNYVDLWKELKNLRYQKEHIRSQEYKNEIMGDTIDAAKKALTVDPTKQYIFR